MDSEDKVKFPRQKKYKEKKAVQDPDFKNNESKRISAIRKEKRSMETEDEKSIRKEKNCLRMRAKREKQRNEKGNKIKIVSSPSKPMSPRISHARKFGYRSRCSLNKAVKKLMKGTPESPVKKRAVIEKLAEEAGLKVLPSSPAKYPDVIKPNAITEDVIKKVEHFFMRTDIVWTSPNIKDEMTVWNDDGSKQKLSKYFLEMTMDEAYGLFKDENPGLKIGRSKCSIHEELSFRSM